MRRSKLNVALASAARFRRPMRRESFDVARNVGTTGGCVALAVALALSACGRSSREGAAPNGQVIARIEGEVVTLPELENEYRLTHAPHDDENTKRLLADIVLRKYLAHQAVASKLDREPSTYLDLFRAREQILASAYLQRQVDFKTGAMSSAEISRFVAQRQSQFSERRLLHVDQISVAVGDRAREIVEATKADSTIAEIERELTKLKLPYKRSAAMLESSAVPDELLARVEARNKDEVFFVYSGGNGLFFKLLDEAPNPLTGEEAKVAAKELLTQEAFAKETQLAQSAALSGATFEGEYAKLFATARDKAPAEAPQPAK
ncbi:MAG TPA: hypothetical protein VK446_09245 [Methylocystis sp.]|nr:hypothetical protein [Methylocystis sp.]